MDVQQQPPLQPGYQRRCKLPDFWPSNPVLWFARAEFNFEVAGVVTEREKFMHTANALPYDALTLVADLVTQPPAVQPFQRLKERLLLSHQLTIVQMAEKILDMPELGDRRPSQLLAAMMEFCPEGEVNSAFFRASFLRRLPKEIRVLLTDEVRGDLKDLAVRADELFQHHRSSPIAALDDTVDTELAEAVAALAVGPAKVNSAVARRSKTETLPILAAVAVASLAVASLAVASLAAAVAGPISCVTDTGGMELKLTTVMLPRRASGARKTSRPGGGGGLRPAWRQWPFSSSGGPIHRRQVSRGHRGRFLCDSFLFTRPYFWS